MHLWMLSKKECHGCHPAQKQPKSCQGDYDKDVYKERNLVERLFQKLKENYRIATRYVRLARNYLAILSLVSTVIWLK